MAGPKVKRCPKCKGEMEEGVLLDHSDFGSQPQEWAQNGAVFMGVGWIKRINIISYRCTKCGFLENYASAPM